MREFYVYGFKNRNEYDAKSARSYDDERRRISAEIILFKAPSIIPPMIPCCQFRPEQPQGLLCELIHLRIESVALQLSVQFLLFGLQFPPLYEIELVLQIGNDLFWGADKQFERITVAFSLNPPSRISSHPIIFL